MKTLLLILTLLLTFGLNVSQPHRAFAETRTAPFDRPDPGPAYEVNWLVDLPATLVAWGMSMGWVLSDSFPPPHCGVVQPCSKDHLWGIDATVAGRYDTNWEMMSDITLYSLMGGSMLTLFADEHWKHALNDMVVIAEAMMISTGITLASTLATRRPRPYMYSTEAPEELRALPRSALSFFSGHTATAFSLTTALFSTIRRRRPDSSLQWIVLGAGLTLSTAVATGRVVSGNHFPSDVVIGALVGSSLGLAIPALHRTPEQTLRLISMGSGLGLKLSWR